MACCSSYHYIPPSVKHLTGRIQDSSPICVFRCRFATSTPRYSMKRSARDSARTLQDPWRGLSISSRNAWWVQTLSARLWFILFSHSSVALCTCVYCFRVINQIHKKTVTHFLSCRILLLPLVWGCEFPLADAVPAFAVFFLSLPVLLSVNL